MLTSIKLDKKSIYITSSNEVNLNFLKNELDTFGFIGANLKFELVKNIKLRVITNKDVLDFTAHHELDNYVYEVKLKNKLKIGDELETSNIKELKLIFQKNFYDHSESAKKIDELDKKSFKILHNYMFSIKNEVIKLRDLNIKIAKKSIKVFKGIRTDWLQSPKQEKFFYNKLKNDLNVFDSYTFSFKNASSWTTNLAIADDFAFVNKPYIDFVAGAIISVVVKPKDIIIDTRLLSKKILSKLYYEDQREIILMPGQYTCKIIHKY